MTDINIRAALHSQNKIEKLHQIVDKIHQIVDKRLKVCRSGLY